MSDPPALTEAAMRKQMLFWEYQERAQRAEVRKREPPKQVEILTLAELFEQPDPVWLIEGWLQEDSLAVIAGQSDTGKSFVALSIGCCIASDVDWFGHTTQHGQVTYVYSEGSSGIKKRIDAWLKAHGKVKEALNFMPIPDSVNMLEERHVMRLIADIKERAWSPKVLMLNTLARNFGAGNENATPDMNAFVRGCDLLRRAFPGCAVLVVHHTGWDPTHERGNSALRGGVDTLIKQERRRDADQLISLTVVKQKNFEEDARPFFLRLKDVQGSISATLFHADPPMTEQGGNATDEKVFAALATIHPDGMKPGEIETATGIPRSTVVDSRKRLGAEGRIREHGGKVFAILGVAPKAPVPVRAREAPFQFSSPEQETSIKRELGQ